MNHYDRIDLSEKLASVIINLRRECPKCHGNKVEFDERNDRAICSQCHGTGQGERYLAEVCEDQTPPKNSFSYLHPKDAQEKWSSLGFSNCILHITTPHLENGRQTVWVKVYCE
jgi:ribosomal protein S27AE